MIEMTETLIDKFFLGDRVEVMHNHIPNKIVDLIFTSPPYNLAKNYTNNEDDKCFEDYLTFLLDTWKECYRVLKDDGRIVINVGSIVQKGDYIPLHSLIIQQMLNIGYSMRGCIIWDKSSVLKRSCWGSWKSPSDPFVVYPYEYLLVFNKRYSRHEGDKENIDIEKDEFIKSTYGIWKIAPENNKEIKKVHPAPFPIRLVEKVLRFYTYVGDLILDPFGGSGTVAYAAKMTGRNFIYIDNSKEYFNYAQVRLSDINVDFS